MATLRTGSKGQYYGSTFSTSSQLSEAQMKVNAQYIQRYLSSEGWTKNAIAALLGNMQAESSINPGRWQSDDVGNYGLGYGLVQWTPVTKYTDWCEAQGFSDPSEMDNNLKRILYEVSNGLQWYATPSYNISFSEFSSSIETVSRLAVAFLLNYERPADQSESVQNYRASLATAWFNYLGDNPDTPIIPDTPTDQIKRKQLSKLLLYSNTLD